MPYAETQRATRFDPLIVLHNLADRDFEFEAGP